MTELDMIDFGKVLKSKDYIGAMRELGFELLPQDLKYPNDYFFFKQDIIVFYSVINSEYITYPKANMWSLTDRRLEVEND